MSKSEIIIIEELSKKYSGFTALDKLNLKINSNTCVGFLGPNGAGKSTTIKILTGLLRPTSGKAYISGWDVTKNTQSALSNVGAVVETPEFYPNLSPQEVLSYFGKLRGMSKSDIKSQTQGVLDLVGLEKWRKKKIGKFSKGMKQRVAIACALLHDPSIIIVDELTAGLDPRGIIEVREILKSLKKKGKTIFMSSHLLGETQEICDMVALLDKGKLLRYDKVSNIENISKNSRIKIETFGVISESDMSMISNLQGVVEIKKESPSAFDVKFNGGLDARAEFLKNLQVKGIKVVTFKSLGSDLESLYMDLVSQSEGDT